MKDIWQNELQKLLNCEFKTLFPLARSMKRKLKFYVGPTNSGKTYNAMLKLKDANSGVYLAPLRLLALEAYENLQKDEHLASLITGEEQIINEDASYVCSTIEMLDISMDVDIAIIDEVQLIDDTQRAWAWLNAIIGVPANEVIMTGSINALSAIKKIASYLGEDLEVIKHKRKTPLNILPSFTSLNNLKKGSALIAFSRRDVLNLKQKLQKKYKVSVIYGNLSPEVRKEEARKFRHRQSDILIATDAIALGLNLPIETVLFTSHTKFDGFSKRKITVNEIIQIAGRAGRYGKFEVGYLGACSRDVLEHITSEYKKPVKTIKEPFSVKINAKQLQDLSSHIKTKSLSQILRYFQKHMSFDGPFIACNISSMISAAKIVDNVRHLSLEDKYLCAQAPISIKSELILKAYEYYVFCISLRKVCTYKNLSNLNKKNLSQKDLLAVEDEVKKITLYLWLSYKFPDLFIDYDKALKTRSKLNSYIEKHLKTNLRDYKARY